MNNAMASYLALCDNEVVNASRLKAYVENGIKPPKFDIKCSGCEGLEDILPCLDEDGEEVTPVNGYQLPELDPAPWYDPAAPESKNFAGLLVTSVTMSSPYQRTTTQNIGNGQTLGRLRIQGRTITVQGWLIAKTCCAAQYGLQWLTTLLGDPPCSDRNCGGCDLDFLSCCPSIGDGEDDCITTVDENGQRQTFVRPDADSEYERAEDFFRTMHGAGVISGPDVLACRGGSCGGCGCAGSIVQVEFVLGTGSPYINHQPVEILTDEPAPACDGPDEECNIEWVKGSANCRDAKCATEADDSCLDDPLCELPLSVPKAGAIIARGCGCAPLVTSKMCVSSQPTREWGSSTFNFEVFAGSKPLRNLLIQVWQNPQERDCMDEDYFDDCSACSTLLVSYIPTGGTLRFSGEQRTVTIECGGQERSGYSNVTDVDGQPFDWPDLNCTGACLCATFDCENTAPDATVSVERVERDL